jgi:fucose permease
VFIPLGVLWTGVDASWLIYGAFAAGTAITGVFPLVMATVPSEIAPAGITATALSLTMGTSEIVGGVLAPTIAGRAADAYGLAAPMWIVMGLAVAAGLVALLLRETSPLVLARRASRG